MAATTTTPATLLKFEVELTLFDRNGDVIGVRNDMTVWGTTRDAERYFRDMLNTVRDRAGVSYTCYWQAEQYRVHGDGTIEVVRTWVRRRHY